MAREAKHHAEILTAHRESAARKRGQRIAFLRSTQARDLSETARWENRGYCIVNSGELKRPFLIFELHGRRTYEHFESESPPEGEELLAKKLDTTAITSDQITLAFEVMIQREADAIERRCEELAERTKMKTFLILDALTIEMTGRFIGRARERDEQILKTQPVL